MSVPPGEKSKAQLRAERRAIQEAQRAAKAERKVGGESSLNAVAQIDKHNSDLVQKDNFTSKSKADAISQKNANKMYDGIEPHISFKNLGADYLKQCPSDVETQTLTVLEALKQMIEDYSVSPGKSCRREIDTLIDCCFQYIAGETPFPPNISTLSKQLKYQISALEDANEEEVKRSLLDLLEEFQEQNLTLATTAITMTVADVVKKMKEQPVILTYSYSSTIGKCFCKMKSMGIDFEAVVIDDGPQGDGFKLVQQIVPCDIPTQYALLNGIRHVLRHVNLIILGAFGILANGNVLASVGCCQVAQIAQTKNIPVLVLCQTYKFCEKVMTTSNEACWSGCEVLPAEFVTGVVSEIRMLPCTAVPAVLRVKQPA